VLNKFLPQFFNELNSHGIQYCVWGNYEFLPYDLNGSDLDVVVKESNKIIFKSILNDSRKKFNGKIVSYFDTKRSAHYRIAGIYKDISWGIMIDVIYEEFYYMDKIYLPSKWIRFFTIKHNEINVNDLGFSYLAGFLKELIHNGVVKEKYLTNTSLEIKSNSEKYKFFINDVYGEDFLNLLLAYFNNSIEDIDLGILQKKIKKSIRSGNIGVFKKKISKLERLINPSPGYTIAFLGTDGSGKSTIIENIKPTLSDAFHKAVYYEHMRPNKFPSIAKLLGNSEEFKGPVTNPHASSTSGFLGSFLRWSYYMLDYTVGFYLKIWPKKAIRSCVWIFDRYYYDYLIDPKRGRIKLPKWLLKLGQFIIPEPDLILCLGTDAAAIHKRKPELTLKEVERQVLELRTFCESHKKAVWIDTGKDIETSSNDALEVIITMMSKRFESVDLTK
jgi:thymidylate kinase